jgi:hypothetical protein
VEGNRKLPKPTTKYIQSKLFSVFRSKRLNVARGNSSLQKIIIDAKRFEENYCAELGYSSKTKRVVKDIFYLPMGKFFGFD